MKRLYGIVGPSGSGKSTLVKYCSKKLGYSELLSTTTRDKREGEVDGKDYHFITKEEFLNKEMIQRDEYAGNYYGTAKKDVDDAFKENDIAFMVLTFKATVDFKEIFKNLGLDIEVKSIFINTPIEELRKRMELRGDLPENIEKRINNITASHEYENKDYTDYVYESDVSLSIEENCENFVKFIQGLK